MSDKDNVPRDILGLINNEEGGRAFFGFENTDMLGDFFELQISAEIFWARNVWQECL